MPSPKLILWVAAISLGTTLALERFRERTS